MTGREHRWIFPRYGALKRLERVTDEVVSRFVYPHVFGLWNPYSWLLPRRLTVAEATLEPPRWPRELRPLRVLHLSDIHTGNFLRPDVLAGVLAALMEARPDLVAIAGDVVTGSAADLDGFLEGLAVLSTAPLGAWFCFGNHDYFAGDSALIEQRLGSVGIHTLRNELVHLRHADGNLAIGGIDDRILGKPNWDLLAAAGAPHLLLAHHPDDFYEAERRGAAVVLSGHTHGGQIRLRSGRPIVRQSRFYLDEGLFEHGEGLLVVSRGLGAVGIPWRAGADPEAVLLTIRPRRSAPVPEPHVVTLMEGH